METTDPYAHEPAQRPTAEEGSRLNISPVPATQFEPQDAHWLRMDPSLTRAVLAKTEEDLLGGLAALMRNKVEHEQLSRRLAQVQIDFTQANHELDAIRRQIRRAEEEIATRINEQNRIDEEITTARKELVTLREEHRRHLEAVSGLKHDAAQTQQLLTETQQHLGSVKDDVDARLAEHRDVTARLDQIKNEKTALEDELRLLRSEVHDRIGAREALNQEIEVFDRHLSELATPREKAEQPQREEGLPLLFGSEFHPISDDWDSYPLESEFHTDEELDAKKVAELTAQLPGLEGCLIVKNQGPVLAAQLPERIHAYLKVSNRNYHLLFERLEKKVHEYNLPNARLATFDLGDEGLTIAQASQAFVFVNHQQTQLRPGIPDKLASIVAEIAKMYP
jgi:predicted  nucleic acid-binding Zn-ribbon protein